MHKDVGTEDIVHVDIDMWYAVLVDSNPEDKIKTCAPDVYRYATAKDKVLINIVCTTQRHNLMKLPKRMDRQVPADKRDV